MKSMAVWRWVLPILMFGLWLGLAGTGGPTFGKLDEVSSNDQTTFLPKSADSTKVQALQGEFASSATIPAIVVFESSEALTGAQLNGMAGLSADFNKIAGVVQVAGPIPSKDGRAVEYIVSVASSDVQSTTPLLRKTAAAANPDGLKMYVTGPAGLLNDLVAAFGGIDGILLLVAVAAVFIILIAVYRSVILPFLVLMVALFALCAAVLVIYLMGKAGWITLNGQSQGILSILVIGAATDYALLIVSRFREELGYTASRWTALAAAMRGAIEPVTASAATVAVALLCLLASDLGSNRSLGPVAATGIVAAWLSAVTFLPALLMMFGRAAFWPATPKQHPATTAESAEAQLGLDGITGIWRWVGHLIARRPWATWFATAAVLAVAAAGLLQLRADGVAQSKVILSKSQAVEGQAVLARHYDAGSGSPAIIIADVDKQVQVLKALGETPGVATVLTYTGSSTGYPGAPVAAAKVVDGKVLINATFKPAADSNEAKDVVIAIRTKLDAVDASALVGGPTAVQLDTNTTAQHDLKKIIPLVLVVILIILMLLLRSVLAPILLIGTVVLSYGATLGVSALVFNHIFHFPGADPTVPLFGFVFLVALGIDYNIFLMTRVREESIKRGTRAGILHGLGKTGGVITSAGVVLAATFAALGIIPILFLAQIAFIVAFGVLLDTVLVRSLLVPALSYDIGRAIWWPSKLSK